MPIPHSRLRPSAGKFYFSHLCLLTSIRVHAHPHAYPPSATIAGKFFFLIYAYSRPSVCTPTLTPIPHLPPPHPPQSQVCFFFSFTPTHAHPHAGKFFFLTYAQSRPSTCTSIRMPPPHSRVPPSLRTSVCVHPHPCAHLLITCTHPVPCISRPSHLAMLITHTPRVVHCLLCILVSVYLLYNTLVCPYLTMYISYITVYLPYYILIIIIHYDSLSNWSLKKTQ